MRPCNAKPPKDAPECDPTIIGPELSSEELFGGARTLAIVHSGERYLLRITRQNKLILTK